MTPIEYIRLMSLVNKLKRISRMCERNSLRLLDRTEMVNDSHTNDWDNARYLNGKADGISFASAELGELVRKLSKRGGK